MKPSLPATIRWIVTTLGIAIGYALLARLGLSLAIEHGSVTSVWPPAGFALGMVLVLGLRRAAAGIALGAFVANLPGAGVMGGLAIAAGNTVEAAAAAWVIDRWGGKEPRLGQVFQVFLLFIAAAVGGAIAASVGVSTLALLHIGEVHTTALWVVWFMGDFVGMAVVAPLIVGLVFSRFETSTAKVIEALVILSCSAASAWWVFLGTPGVDVQVHFAFLVFPFLVWAALRLRLCGAATAVLLVAVAATAGTVMGHGPFALGDREEGLEVLQSFLLASVLTALLLSALIAERNHGERRIRVGEERFSLSLGFANVGTWDWDIKSGELHWSERIAPLFGYPEGALETTYDNFLGAVHPEDRQAVVEAVEACVAGQAGYAIEHRVVWPDGTVRWMSEKGGVTRDRKGNPLHMLGVVQDITARKEAEAALRRQTEQFRNLVETTNDWIWELDTSGRYTYSSPQVRTLLGYAAQEVLGQTPFHRMTVRERKRTQLLLEDLLAHPRPFKGLEYTVTRKDGKSIVLESSGVPLFDEEGVLQGFRGTDRDVTQRREGEQRMRLAAQVLANTPEGVMISDAATRIISVNAAFEQTTGYREDEVLGLTPKILASGRHDTAFYRVMWDALNTHGQWQGEIWNRRKDGNIYPEWLNITVLKDEMGTVTHYVGIFSDLSAQEEVRERLHRLAYFDALTDLPNRELFHDRLANTVAVAQREGQRFALLFIDLDRFKSINDSLGHSVGDQLLQYVATKIRSLLRESDTLARLSGDEFSIILPHIRHTQDAAEVAVKILAAFEQTTRVGNHELFVTASIGIAVYPNDGDEGETLLRNADTAMYRAKEAGFNAFRFFSSEMSQRSMQRLSLENDLRRALTQNELSIQYQPQIDLKTGTVVGCEALMRWKRYGMPVSPSAFIPIAEESGMIIPLGRWVLEQALAQLQRWEEEGIHGLRMSVNLSVQQFWMADLGGWLQELLQSLRIPPQRLELELTESVLMGEGERSLNQVRDLADLGLHLAIDDFGTGYSSLSYLKRLNIHRLKIDKSFINDLSTDASDREIVATIVAMAHNLGLSVTAEGVETEEQLDYLKGLGCDEVQGFWYSRAVDPEEFLELVRCWGVAGG